MDTVTVGRLQRTEIPAAASALARAFSDDPVCRFAWPDDGTREARIERFFMTELDTLWKRREVYVDPDLASVAVWARPGEWKAPAWSTVRIVGVSLRTRARLTALRGYLRADGLHPEEPHWYLEALGTVPERQGHGCGGRVLAPVLERADEEGVAVWAWSSNPHNLSFYHRQGFEVLDELPFAPGGPPIFPIRREPRS